MKETVGKFYVTNLIKVWLPVVWNDIKKEMCSHSADAFSFMLSSLVEIKDIALVQTFWSRCNCVRICKVSRGDWVWKWWIML